MEFLPLPVYGALYLTTRTGGCCGSTRARTTRRTKEPGLNLYQELCPLIPMVLSSQPPAAFAQAITDARNPVHAPRIFFADLRLDRDEHGKLVGELPYTDPLHWRI